VKIGLVMDHAYSVESTGVILAVWKLIQCDGVCGAEHTSQLQCIPTNHVMDYAGTAKLEYPMIHAESSDLISSPIQPEL
jgi:hypothetical protein